ncbi:MAG: radical SAM protein [Candidatus Omnitrophica bacterium]|nr:radical SAM protein [Candidatus Omnitrophota bacterium]
MKYIYGPVNSRRLGLSLGLSLTACKICNFDCVYCQLGKTNNKASKRAEYVKLEDIIDELKSWLENNKEEARKLNYITIAGLGEPTLHAGIGLIITKIKGLTSVPVAIITNASLFSDKDVRQALLGADLIVPSLDAAEEKPFTQINRPTQEINLDKIISGLIAFRSEFSKAIWLEVMLVRGVNDDPGHIKKLKEVIGKINPDKIQLNSPVRTTTEPGILPVENTRLLKIKEMLGERCEII